MRALGPASGLEVSTAPRARSEIDALAGAGLSRLGEISTLLSIAAILALAAALTSTIWQRRGALAELRLTGATPARLRRILLLESALMLGAGCLTGALVGLYGQVVIDGYLRDVTGFPIATLDRGPASAGVPRARDRDRARARRRPRLAGRASLANTRAGGVEPPSPPRLRMCRSQLGMMFHGKSLTISAAGAALAGDPSLPRRSPERRRPQEEPGPNAPAHAAAAR